MRLCIRVAALSFTVALLLPLGAFGQAEKQPAKTDFSGRWRMVKEKSDFAKTRMPDAIIRVVDQRGTTLNVHTIQTVDNKTSSADVSYFIDGSESANIINGHDAVSHAFWDGPALLIRTRIKFPDYDEEILDRWELSDDGQTLTTTSQISTTKGGTELKLVCVKEKAPG